MSECWHGTPPMKRCEHCEAEREDSELLMADRERLARMHAAIEREQKDSRTPRQIASDLLEIGGTYEVETAAAEILRLSDRLSELSAELGQLKAKLVAGGNLYAVEYERGAKFGIALMAIREGCADPRGVAREALRCAGRATSGRVLGRHK